jgi:hypothetical protein
VVAPGAPAPAQPTIAQPAKAAANDKSRSAAVTATPVDAGTGTMQKPTDKGGSMSCGAGMCSADMKKGN